MRKKAIEQHIIITKDSESTEFKDIRINGESLMRYIGAIEMAKIINILGWAYSRKLRSEADEHE